MQKALNNSTVCITIKLDFRSYLSPFFTTVYVFTIYIMTNSCLMRHFEGSINIMNCDSLQ